jgi:hypothetical protein
MAQQTGAMARFCGNCGSGLREADYFCRNCGTQTHMIPAVTETSTLVDEKRTPAAATASMPAAAETQPSSAARPPGARREQTRPRWLIPALVAVVLVVGVLAFAGIMAFSGGSEPESLEQVPTRELAPVEAAAASLREEAEAVSSRSQLGSLERAGARLARMSGAASVALADPEMSEADTQTHGLLLDLLRETADYGHAFQAAASAPSPAAFSEVRSQEEDLRDAQDALARANPEVATSARIDVASLVGLEQVQAAEARKSAQKRQQASARKRGHEYANQIDSLLRNSAETRGDLGGLIEDIHAGELTAAQAHAEVTAILNQRQDLQNAISTVDTPASFSGPAELLRSSIGASIDDDKAIQGWITAWWEDDAYGLERFWSQHLEATSRASTAKSDFVATYNEARARVGLQPFTVGASY